MTYKHALALYPYFKDSTATMGVFPPTGLEYITANMKDIVGKLTFLDLRYDSEYRDIEVLSGFIREDVDLICIGLMWDTQFDEICDLIMSHATTNVLRDAARKNGMKLLREKGIELFYEAATADSDIKKRFIFCTSSCDSAHIAFFKK